MADDGAGAPGAGGFVVLREAAAGHWVVVGDVDRRPDRAKVTSTSRQGRRRPGARRRRGLRRAAAQRVAAGPATLGLPVRSAAMRVLVLGGTSFVGRAIAENALRAGARLTLFSRGKTGTDLFPGVPRSPGTASAASRR